MDVNKLIDNWFSLDEKFIDEIKQNSKSCLAKLKEKKRELTQNDIDEVIEKQYLLKVRELINSKFFRKN